MHTSTAALLVEQNKPLVLTKLSIPKLKPYQVLVRMRCAGICRSQINEIKGLKGADPYLPHTLGHEGSGDVLEIGEGVTRVSAGDRVIVSWLKGEGKGSGPGQYRCEETDAIINSGPVSTFLTTAIISQDRLIRIPNTIPYDIAALFGCAIPTGMGMVVNQMALTSSSTVAIFGTEALAFLR